MNYNEKFLIELLEYIASEFEEITDAEVIVTILNKCLKMTRLKTFQTFEGVSVGVQNLNKVKG